MARRAHRAARVHDLPRAAGTIVAHDLELEAAGRLVVADHLDEVVLLLVAEIDAVLEQRRAGECGFDVDRRHHARKLEERGRGGGALEGAPERHQHLFRARLRATGARLDALHERRERERNIVERMTFDLAGDGEIEQRAPGRRQIGSRAGGINRPNRRSGPRYRTLRRRRHRLRRRREWGGGGEQAERGHRPSSPRHPCAPPSHHLAAIAARACVPVQQSSVARPLAANAGPSRSAIALL